jgi:hypothetical protein
VFAPIPNAHNWYKAGPLRCRLNAAGTHSSGDASAGRGFNYFTYFVSIQQLPLCFLRLLPQNHIVEVRFSSA